ncbi:Phospholipase B-like [Carpediemonas membranifera]|uniref:Phospholipase B-like n=1 Tax=Carpediemonas membranifera TaxID=201153 RepID=A0A8J6DZ79_9EUKA|nr:Phospholipase B-like [Carpediemonas membranifera]|eukprot:KAG9393264.1 Phospholipase B-like [Carpediemonas membranifera]
MRTVSFILLIVVQLLIAVTAEPLKYCAEPLKSKPGQFTIYEGHHPLCSSFLTYEASLEKDGWDRVQMTVNPAGSFSDLTKMAGLGFLEGNILAPRITAHRENFLKAFTDDFFKGKGIPSGVMDFLQSNIGYLRYNCKATPDDPYWANINLILGQVDGMLAGYNAAIAAGTAGTTTAVTIEDLYLLMSQGDLLDIAKIVDANNRPDFSAMTPVEVDEYLAKTSHCSALISLDDDYEDLVAGHATWFLYSAMTRILKEVDLTGIASEHVKVKSSVFSSYPAVLASVDDFYTTSAQLAVMETTNNIVDQDLYDGLTPQAVLTWMRAIVTNRLATTGQEWVDTFKRFNSGTYVCQWMIVDYKQFTPGEEPEEDSGLVTIIETIPGGSADADVTDVLLDQGFWPSYNIPYSEIIYDDLGYDTLEEKYGDIWSYAECPRATIFKRDAPAVNHIGDLGRLLRENNWEHDELSLGNPGNAIAARYDLRKPAQGPIAMGAIDAKVVDVAHMKAGHIMAIAGPTYSGQPAWQFSKSSLFSPHAGLPDGPWRYGWQQFPQE